MFEVHLLHFLLFFPKLLALRLKIHYRVFLKNVHLISVSEKSSSSSMYYFKSFCIAYFKKFKLKVTRAL